MKKISRKQIGIIIVIIIGLIGGLIILFAQSSWFKPKESTVANTQSQLKKLLEHDFVNPNLTSHQIKKILGKPISSQDYLLGKDAYIMEKPSQSLIKKYNLKEYTKKQEKYAKNIQQEFLKEFAYEFTTTTKFEDQIHQKVAIKTFYYGMYLLDLNELISWVIDTKKIIPSDEGLTEQQEADLYKYKVLIMEVLDQNLDVYKNTTGEKTEVEIIYRKGKPATSDELYSLLCNIFGETYDNASYDEVALPERQAKYQQQLQKLI